ncbi:hypothetical protein WJM97_17965 [Okeanomitos corallinicola TIOX110]|uniref:Uncharacterized protein n=1 Tax=Okeanomitos corallinicola TIOX110 TaxID=3133117 RepID=A0ABZ2UZI1_9CYAN
MTFIAGKGQNVKVYSATVEPIWEKQVLKLPVASNLSSQAMLKALGEATGVYIGWLDFS